MKSIFRRFSPSSKKKEAAQVDPFTQLLNNNGVEIIETANDGNCFYDAFYRSILTIKNDKKNQIFDPILDTLKNEDLPNLRVPQATIRGDARKEYIKKVNPGAFTNATPVISQYYNDSAKAQGQARLFKQCQTLFIKCCRRYVANNLTIGSLSMINEALCSPRPETYVGVYQSSIKPFLDKILQCPYNKNTTKNTNNQLIVYQNAVKMIKGGPVDSRNTDFKDLLLTSPVWAGQPEMSILQETLGIKLLNFKLEEQNNLTSTFQTLEGANINDDTVYVPLAYNGFHFQTLAVKTHKGEEITYQSASGFDTLPPVLQMLDCFQFKGLEGAPSRNECQMYTKIKDILDLNEQIRKYLSTNYDLILSDSVERITQGYQQFQTNIGILSWTDQLEILNKLQPFFTNCSRLKSVEDLKACKVNDGQPYSDARASILAIVDRSIGNDMETITNYVKNQILNVKSDNFNNIITNLDKLYNTLYPGGGLGSPSIFPQDSPPAGQPAADDANSVIAFVTESINTRIEELQQNIKENKAEPNNPVKDTLKMIESVEERVQREEQQRKDAEEQAKREADRLAKEKAEAEKAAARAAEEEAAERKKAEKAQIQAAISPLEKVAKDQLNQLNNLINEWNKKEKEWKEARDRLTQDGLTVENESDWLKDKEAEEKNFLNIVKSSELVSSGLKEKKKKFTKDEKVKLNQITKELKGYHNFNNAYIRYSKALSKLEEVALQFFTLRENREQSITKMNRALEEIRKQFPESESKGVGEEESPKEPALPRLSTTADLYKEFEDSIKNLNNPLITDLFEEGNKWTIDSVLNVFGQIYSPKGDKIDEFQKMNTEIRSLLLQITLDPYANVHQEQVNLLTDNTLSSQQRYDISNEINRTTQSIIVPWLEKPEGLLVTIKSGGGKRQRKYTATRKSNAKKGGKPNSARGNRSGTRRRGRFARSRSLPRRKPAGNRDRSQKVRSKPNRRTRRSQRN